MTNTEPNRHSIHPPVSVDEARKLLDQPVRYVGPLVGGLADAFLAADEARRTAEAKLSAVEAVLDQEERGEFGPGPFGVHALASTVRAALKGSDQ